ncbi:hypothetical protein PV772_12850 [Pseudarthrobacter sp. CC12]|uniref:hypothetical protein n=1 Tax=Pseudarthrobacter sp. CC12 TaxID=3029193 RepID=UPI00326656B8
MIVLMYLSLMLQLKTGLNRFSESAFEGRHAEATVCVSSHPRSAVGHVMPPGMPCNYGTLGGKPCCKAERRWRHDKYCCGAHVDKIAISFPIQAKGDPFAREEWEVGWFSERVDPNLKFSKMRVFPQPSNHGDVPVLGDPARVSGCTAHHGWINIATPNVHGNIRLLVYQDLLKLGSFRPTQNCFPDYSSCRSLVPARLIQRELEIHRPAMRPD